MKPTSWSRRKFIQFIGASSALTSTSCNHLYMNSQRKKITGLKLNTKTDELSLASGLQCQILLKEADQIGSDLFFGTNNDYTNFYDFNNGRYGLWVNHESLSPFLLHKRELSTPPTKTELKFEREQVGGSFTEIKKNKSGNWEAVLNSNFNFRVSANTVIPLSHPLYAKKTALGTLANCSGGFTPWGTILTCEENFSHFYGDISHSKTGKSKVKYNKRYNFNWTSLDPKPPEHYGWVVEVDPRTKKSEKLIPLGRFSHECATVSHTNDGFPVVYSGDDAKDECLYKFISSNKNSLKAGTLYVADLKKGKWLSLDYKTNKILQKYFKSQTEVLIYTRKAAELLGASKLDRPEDIEVDPLTGDVFVALTNNKRAGNYHGSILKISEKNKADLSFTSSTFKAGGSKAGFSCPDNMAFDQNGNLWITSDISGRSIGSAQYKSFGNNGLFVVPRKGPQAGKVLKVASAPHEAELTGPCFSPDQKTLFLSVQHPGENTKSTDNYTSSWPSKRKNVKPLSCVVTITGELLNTLTQKKGS